MKESDRKQVESDIETVHEALRNHAWFAGVASAQDDGGIHVVVFVDKDLVTRADPMEFVPTESRSCYVTGKSHSK